MWKTVFASNGGRIQRSSSTSSSMDLINEQRLVGGYGVESRTIADPSELQQVPPPQLAKKKSSNVKLRKKEEKNPRKPEGQQTEEPPQDYLSIKSSLIESKKKLTKKLNIKFRPAPSEKIKRRTYEQMECAVILNDTNKMSALLREHPKLGLHLAHDLRPDGTTLLHTAVRYQCKDALSWLASRCNRFQINQQNTAGDSPLHCAVRERSPILVNILLNHKACNHVQNYTSRSTPLLLALGLYIKYRNLKDCACAPGDSEPASSRSNSTASERSVVQDCFCQKKEKSFDLLQLETNNNRHPRGSAGRPAEKENDSSNLNRLIGQSAAMAYAGVRNHPSSNSKLDDLTADFLNRQNCCRAGDAPANCPLPASYRSDNEAINNCRLMRKIVMAILHDSDSSSWRLADAHGQTVIRMAKENQVDFVYDFISNYQKLAVIMKPAPADQNNNHYSATDAFQAAVKQDALPQENGGLNGPASQVLKQEPGHLPERLPEHLNGNLNGHLPENMPAVVPNAPSTVSQVASEIRAATICDYYLPTYKPAFSKHLQGEKVVEEAEEEEANALEFENATMNKTNGAVSSEAAAMKSETHSTNQHCPTEASRFVSSYTSRNEQRNEFNGRNDGHNGSKPAVNQHKRKTDDEQQYCSALRGQRSIIRADNFLPFTKSSAVCGPSAGCSVANSINRKSNRSRSITLGHINLLDRNHNLFTSSCSLNRLSELENRKALDHLRQFNNRDQRPADQLQFEQQQKLPNSFDYFQPLDEAPVTYSNIPNEFRDCQQFAASKQSIGCSRSDAIAKQPSLMNQTNVKTALAVYR